ncbi:MAG: glycosyltransferase [Alphaproteobacteria bacterium]
MTLPVVGIFLENLHGGGAEKLTVVIANALAARGYPIEMLLWEATGTHIDSLSPQVKIINLSEQGRASPFRVLAALMRYLRDRPPAVFFTHLERPSLLGIVASWFVGYRHIVPCVHVDFNGYAMIDYRTRRTFLKYLVAFFYRFTDAILAVSDGAGRSVRKLVGKRPRIFVVKNGFDFDRLRHDMAAAIDFPWLNNKDAPVFVGCGRLVPQKEFDVLLRAFAAVRRRQAARLIILGEGPQRHRLEALARQLGVEGDVAMPGYMQNPMAWFSRSDVFVLSSKVEGFGNVLIEALFAGMEVASTDCLSGPSEILQDGQYGDLVKVGDVKGMADAMGNALDRRKTRAEDHAAQLNAYLKDNYAISNMIDGYLHLIEEIAAEPVGVGSRGRPGAAAAAMMGKAILMLFRT